MNIDLKAIDELQKGLQTIQDKWTRICDNCVECCKEQEIHLNNYDAHMVAEGLQQRGGFELVKKHLRYNSRPFNVFTRFLFTFKDRCPFHTENSCSFYKHRPLACRLYPMVLTAFFDNSSSKAHEPILFFDIGMDGYSCKERVREVIELVEFSSDLTISELVIGSEQLKILATYTLDEYWFYYLFAQPMSTGIEFLEPRGEDRHWSGREEVESCLLDAYLKRFGIIDSEIDDGFGTIPVTKKFVKRFLSDNSKHQHRVHKEHEERVRRAFESPVGYLKLRQAVIRNRS